MSAPRVDIAVVGAGAAGLMAAIWARRTAPTARVVAVDSARRLGAKILISGGGRCNVTHHEVTADAFAGSSRNAIRKVLRSFDVDRTTEFFAELGVDLKREPTGKLLPTTDSAHTVLDALVRATVDAGVELQHPFRVESLDAGPDGFELAGPEGSLAAERVVLATGGRSIPKSGSDGHGYHLARGLGHFVGRTWPALVPLTLPAGHPLRALRGIAADVELRVERPNGKRIARAGGSLLCTHFGVSGPAAMDISRFLLDARRTDPTARLVVNWIPDWSLERLLQAWKSETATATTWLRTRLPERLARTLLDPAGLDPTRPIRELAAADRRRVATSLVAYELPVSGDRGYTYAEVTAGGVPLAELHLDRMESRICPGLFLCGEICDVDGRIGGFNFQWAWSSGYVAGRGAGRAAD